MFIKGIKLILITIFLSTLFLLVGCPSEKATPPEEKPKTKKNTPAKEKSKSGGINLTIVSPKNQETIKGPLVTVEVKVENVTLVNPSGVNNPNEGHLHLSLKSGGKEKGVTTTEKVTQFSGVTPGEYTLIAELAQNDHSAFTPPVEQGINFIVSP